MLDALVGQVIVVDPENRRVPKQLGWESAPDFNTAMDMARSFLGKSQPEVTMSHAPPASQLRMWRSNWARNPERMGCPYARHVGKHLFVTGVTGFVGKVLLAMIAERVPDVRRVSVLVRTNREYENARDRFDGVVRHSEPLEQSPRDEAKTALRKWCDEVVNVVRGDITLDRMGLSDAAYDEMTKNDPVDLILHCAGNVNFNPPLDQALAVNAQGGCTQGRFARDAGAPLVHMSTCFVAGCQSGPIPETEESRP